MSIAVEAVWESGVLKPKTRLDLPEKTSVRVIVETGPVVEAATSGDDDATGWTTAMELVGCIKGGAPDVARNHDKYLYDKA
jgi:predicted DNA-binding antitoxin AbrB/MazE fold protein